MKSGSIVSRATRGAVLASLVTAVLLAATAAAISLGLWRVREEQTLRQTAEALAAAVQREAVEESWAIEPAVRDAVEESSVAGYRVEAWRGDRLLVSNLAGEALGPPGRARAADGWLVVSRSLPERVELLVAAPKRGGEAVRVFAFSLALALPVCALAALAIGRLVGRRATRPLVEFRGRLSGARPFQPLPPAELAEAPAEVRELDEAFRALWSGLEQAHARERDFAASASHELRTPLTRIRLHAERAAARSDDVARSELKALTDEVDRLVRLIESLLLLARDVTAGLPRSEVVNLADVLRVALPRVLDTAPCFDAPLPDEALVRGDEELLGIAVENLLDNARKFRAHGQPVGVSLSDEGGRVRLTVTSPGARVPAAERERLFERFYRSAEARAGDGHGLGLPLARQVARLHGGDVDCVSTPSEDAAFALDLPSWATSHAPSRVAAESPG